MQGFACFIISKKLQMLKVRIKDRRREVFGILDENRDCLVGEVEGWDREEKERDLTHREMEARRAV